MSVADLLGKWTRNCGSIILDVITCLVFLSLDLFDAVLCVIYKLLDEFFEGKATTPCYCGKKGGGDQEKELSETLFSRKNFFREMAFLGFARKWENGKERDGYGGRGGLANRWSDCGCESCVSWMKKGNEEKLHVVVRELPPESSEDCRGKPAENVIFLHGFLSSSSFWTETVFKHLSGAVKDHYYKLFAVDLLGFGKAQSQLRSFHLVAHSMGCIIAVALAAKCSKLVKSVTLVAPPYFPSAKDGTSSTSMVLETVAGKILWPPLAFGKSVMSWYEHVGRCFCFLFCRNHRTWEWILKLLTRRR
ncbi:hypothetical protein DITRI_Ditri06bG0120600 [Diplodiscus trichospermus]